MTFDIQGGTDASTLYDVFMTTNLVGNGITNSQWTRLERGPSCSTYQYTNQPNAVAFYVLGLTNDVDGDLLSDVFERLVSKSDPTDWDMDNDDLPDGWEWNHFGNFNQTASGDYDADGISNLQEFINGTDPNNVNFTAHFGYGQFSSTTITGTVEILKGEAVRMAILVDSDNFGAANWQAYDAGPVVTLPATQ